MLYGRSLGSLNNALAAHDLTSSSMDRDVGALQELLGVILTASGSLFSLLTCYQLLGAVFSCVHSLFNAHLSPQLAFGAWAINYF